MNTMQTSNSIQYHFSYVSEYSEIYESSYETSFVFVDEEDFSDQQPNDLDSLIIPPFSS